ncbi:14525_t:CDS:10 [Ambispora leptoticha]|uniref:Chromatin modification-related protein EAF3 n=1 Tax=Ambispora leptoticha TaxID=144679 RepID=A0A9N8VDI0_9GLOM|nr:14525_t:CDS:10 [Ambispora leptoticha]
MNDSSSLPNQNALMFEENEEVLCFQGSLLYKVKILQSENCQLADTLGSSDENRYYRVQFIESNSSMKDEWVASNRILKLTSENLEKQIQLHEKFIQSIENNIFISKEGLIKESINQFSNSQEMQASPNNDDRESEIMNSGFKEKEKDGILPAEEISSDELYELYNHDYDEYSDSTSSSQEESEEQDESSCMDSESDDSDIHFEFPKLLIHKLCEDRENVVKYDKVISTPRAITVKQILERWVVYQKAEDGYHTNSMNVINGNDEETSLEGTINGKDIYSEMAEGLMKHFDRVLIRNLLYTNEKPISHQNLKFSEIYGAEHLLRLLYQLPSFLEMMKLTQHAIKELTYRSAQIMNFLVKNADEFFTTSSTKTRKSKDLLKNARTRISRRIKETKTSMKRKRRKIITKKSRQAKPFVKRSSFITTNPKETGLPSKKQKVNLDLEDYICENCVTTFSTQWRLGLNGERLCNGNPVVSTKGDMENLVLTEPHIKQGNQRTNDKHLQTLFNVFCFLTIFST